MWLELILILYDWRTEMSWQVWDMLSFFLVASAITVTISDRYSENQLKTYWNRKKNCEIELPMFECTIKENFFTSLPKSAP